MNIIEQMLDKAYLMRGKVLQAAIEIETLIDQYISKHFTSNKESQTEFVTLILAPRVSFNDKLDIFRYLADKYNPEFKRGIPKYYQDLLEIIKERNMFAHYPVDFAEESLEDFKINNAIALVRLKNHKEYGLSAKASINDEIVEDLVKKMKHYSLSLYRLVYGKGTASPPA